jgi:hypothetical protein
MKYLSLNSDEIKELIALKKGSFIGYLITFIVILVVSYFVLDRILPDKNGISPISIVFILTTSNLILFFYFNRSYFHDLLKKEKKVYKGVLSSKTCKVKEDNKYQFNVDGNIFVVDKDIYERFNEGDIIECHISAFTKHIFKVEKVGEAA